MCIWGKNAYKVRDLGNEEIDAFKKLAARDGLLISPIRLDHWEGDKLEAETWVRKAKDSGGVYCFAQPSEIGGWGYSYTGYEVWLKISGRVAYHHAANGNPPGYRAEKARAVAWRRHSYAPWQPLDTLPGRVRGLDMTLQTIDETPAPIIVNGIFLIFAVAWNVAVVTGLFGL